MLRKLPPIDELHPDDEDEGVTVNDYDPADRAARRRGAYRPRGGAALVVALALVLSAGVAAPAAASTSADPAIAAALARIDSGGYTAADLGLIRAHPDIARYVPDPSQPASVTFTRSALRPAAPGINSSTSADASVTQYSLLGFVLYVYHHRLAWTYSGGAITQVTSRYDYVTQADPVIYIRELVGDSLGPTGGWSIVSFFQRHIEYCVISYGCYANTYPHIWLTAYANGTASASGAPY